MYTPQEIPKFPPVLAEEHQNVTSTTSYNSLNNYLGQLHQERRNRIQMEQQMQSRMKTLQVNGNKAPQTSNTTAFKAKIGGGEAGWSILPSDS